MRVGGSQRPERKQEKKWIFIHCKIYRETSKKESNLIRRVCVVWREGAEYYLVEHESLVPGPFAVCSGRSVGTSLSSHKHIASTTQNATLLLARINWKWRVKSRMMKKKGRKGRARLAHCCSKCYARLFGNFPTCLKESMLGSGWYFMSDMKGNKKYI